MINDEIITRLFEMKDEEYRDFQSKLIPNVDIESFIGVRTPALKSFAKEISKRPDKEEFLCALPHRYFDEYQLHAFSISLEKDFQKCVYEVERLLPYVDNWAVCDQLCPQVFKKHRQELTAYTDKWLGSNKTYTIRFAIKMLMTHYLDDSFDPRFPAAVADIRSDEYYVNMMRAWYFATALAKQYESVLPYITERRMDAWTHNKAIQKAVESNRISPETKQYLRTLKVPKA